MVRWARYVLSETPYSWRNGASGRPNASLVEYPDAWHPPAGLWDCAWRVPTHSGHRRLFQGRGPTAAGDRAPLSGRPHSRQGAVSTGAPPSEKEPPTIAFEDVGYEYPESQTPWQEIQSALVDELSHGMVLKPAVKYQRIAEKGPPRDNH